MSKALAVLQELKECASYWSEYDVPIGIHERIDEAIAELLAQPEHIKERELLKKILATARARKNCLSCKPAVRHPPHAYLDKI